MSNVIPRTATKLKVTFLTNTSHFRKGDTTVVEKRGNGMWSDGKYSLFQSHLRISELCKVEIL